MFFLTDLGGFDCNWRSNGENIYIFFNITSRDRSRKNPQWSEVMMSLNPVIPHLYIVVSISIEHNRKSVLSDPLKNDLESQVFPCLWSNRSNSLQSRHIFATPHNALMKGSFQSTASTIWWSSFCLLFIAIMMSMTATFHGWYFLFVCCITNHCCFIIVVSSTVSICPLQGLYMVQIVVQQFFFLRVLWRSIIPYLKDLVLFVGLQMRHCLKWTLQFLLVCSLNSIWYLIQRYTH